MPRFNSNPARTILLFVTVLIIAAAIPTYATPPQPKIPVDLLITNGLIITMDAQHRILENAAIAIRSDAILAIGPTADLESQYSPTRTIDAHGAIVIPHDIAAKIPDAAELCGRRETPILEIARSPDFTLEKLKAALKKSAEIH